jgi:preprotein translocase subunit SecE
MGLEIQKYGQGKITRVAAYLLGGLLVIFGAVRLYATINGPGHEWTTLPVIGHVSVYSVISLVVCLLGFLGVHLVLNSTAAVDLLIDTEQELKKVSWPSKSEVKNATLVVVLTTVALAVILYGFDELLRWLFRLVY